MLPAICPYEEKGGLAWKYDENKRKYHEQKNNIIFFLFCWFYDFLFFQIILSFSTYIFERFLFGTPEHTPLPKTSTLALYSQYKSCISLIVNRVSRANQVNRKKYYNRIPPIPLCQKTFVVIVIKQLTHTHAHSHTDTVTHTHMQFIDRYIWLYIYYLQ